MGVSAMEIQQEINLQPYNSFGVDAWAAEFATVTDPAQLPALFAYAREQSLPTFVLGGGTNLLWVNDFPGLVLHMATRGVHYDEGRGTVQVAAGENWHQLVINTLNKKFYGLENLALIPGSVGAAPVQNIGAYGVELARFVTRVNVYDCATQEFRTLEPGQCGFSYRDSIFKQSAGSNLVITGVELQLQRSWQPCCDYEALRMALPTTDPDPQQVFETVCRIRQQKLPDPATLGNAGSFFKNPEISAVRFEELRRDYPQLPAYPTEDPALVKIPAAWLLDTLGWKGRQQGSAAVHRQHALVLVNRGNASGEELYSLAQKMAADVLSNFGIALQNEVRIV